MPPYLRQRLFRGWDWFTPREIQHLPWREQERLMKRAWEDIRLHPRYRLVSVWLPFVGASVALLSVINMFLKIRSYVNIILMSISIIQSIITLVWQRQRFRQALRQKLLEAHVRPCKCFECGYYLEGFEGNECPSCDSPLIMHPDSSHSTS
jgi:predicted Zn-ribbon and HTH transcriptional regulator